MELLGRDQRLRVVDLHTAKDPLRRSIHKLDPLPYAGAQLNYNVILIYLLLLCGNSVSCVSQLLFLVLQNGGFSVDLTYFLLLILARTERVSFFQSDLLCEQENNKKFGNDRTDIKFHCVGKKVGSHEINFKHVFTNKIVQVC